MDVALIPENSKTRTSKSLSAFLAQSENQAFMNQRLANLHPISMHRREGFLEEGKALLDSAAGITQFSIRIATLVWRKRTQSLCRLLWPIPDQLEAILSTLEQAGSGFIPERAVGETDSATRPGVPARKTSRPSVESPRNRPTVVPAATGARPAPRGRPGYHPLMRQLQ